MPNISVSVGGQVISLPGGYVNTSVTPQVPNGALVNTLLFVAASYGVPPFTPTTFTDPNSLQQAMRGAPSADFVPFMFNPSSEVNGTSLVTLINVAPNTQSTATILSSGIPSSGVINLKSTDYGTPSNQLEYSITSGAYAGSQAVTITDGFSGNIYSSDLLGIPFQLAYTGTATTVTYSITSSIVGQATSFTITSPNHGESINLDLTSQTYNQVQNVVEYLNGTGYYSAIILNNGLLPSSYLDVISNVALPAPVDTVDQYVNVTATLGDIVYWINSQVPVATSVIATGITSSPSFKPANIALAYFSGATNGVPSLANYASGLNIALNIPTWVVHIDSNIAGVRALGAQHVAQASNIVNGQWRRYFTGSVLNETPTTAETNALQTNQNNVSYFWPGIQATSLITGVNTFYDGNHVAAAAAGIACGNPVPLPLTNKTLHGNGVEQLVGLSTLTQLQNSGVLTLNYPANTRIPTFLADVTTWQNDSNPENIYNQQIACQFALSYYLVRTVQPYVGTIASNFDEARILTAIKGLLNQLIYAGTNSIGILNNWDPTSLTLIYDGSTQTANVSVAVVFVGQNRIIIVNVTVNPLNIQINGNGTVTNA